MVCALRALQSRGGCGVLAHRRILRQSENVRLSSSVRPFSKDGKRYDLAGAQSTLSTPRARKVMHNDDIALRRVNCYPQQRQPSAVSITQLCDETHSSTGNQNRVIPKWRYRAQLPNLPQQQASLSSAKS
jgi:hypothetical protein